MVDNPTNVLIEEIVIDLSTIFNQPFSALQNEGNEEIAEASKRLAGMFVQPTTTNLGQYDTAKGYLMQEGASEEAAAALALLVANLAKLTGKSTNSIIRQIENAGIRLTEDTYIGLNQLRDPETQWFFADPPDNSRSRNRLIKSMHSCVSVAPPTNFIGTSVSSGQIDLAWADNAINETGYRIDRSLDQITWTELIVLPKNSSSHNDTTVSVGTTYYYRISAFDVICRSPYADIITVVAQHTVISGYGTLTLTSYDTALNVQKGVVSNFDTLTLTPYTTLINVSKEIVSNFDALTLTPYLSVISTGITTAILDELGANILDETGNSILEE